MKNFIFLLLSSMLFYPTLWAKSNIETPNPCLNDSLRIVSDSTWTVIDNTLGQPNGVSTSIITYQYNTLTGYPDAKWISCQKAWLVYTTIGDSTTDDYMTLRYDFKNCKPDSVTLHFLVRRDNYVRIYLDGTLVHADPVVFNTDYLDKGDSIIMTKYLDSCHHTLDFRVYNRNSISGGNGFGLFVAGYLTSKNNSLLQKGSGCDTSACCSYTVTNPCLKDSLRIVSDSNWMVIDNTIGMPSGVNASVLSYQHNSLSGYPDAKWISCQKAWLHYTTYGDTTTDQYMTLRYSFKNCKPDSVTLNFLIRRDNYVTIYLDGVIIHRDPAVHNSTFYNTGTNILMTKYLDSCLHTLDFRVYDRNEFTGGNGFGMFVAGYLTSKSNSLLQKGSECDTASCCKEISDPNYIYNSTYLNNTLIYPNPAYDKLNIELNQKFSGTKYTISNILGQKLNVGILNDKHTVIPISQLTSGVYILLIEYADKKQVLKFYKE